MPPMPAPQSRQDPDIEVLVVGAGPVGLALAVELGRRGIRTVVIEQNERAARQPRAKTTNVRTMEHMRRWGIADTLRASAPLPADYPTDIIFATRLFGPELARFENAFNGRRQKSDLYSEPAQWIPQYKVEDALGEHARSLASVRVMTGTRLDALRQRDDGVEADVVDVASGRTSTISAAYMVGADGSRSRVRALLGIRMEGQHAFAQNYNYVIRAPELREVAARSPAIMYWLVNPDCAGVTGPMDLGDIWFFGFAHGKDEPAPSAEQAKERMRRAFGRDVAIEILVTDAWAAHSLIADRYRRDRVFLAGDACHLHPPFGGYGMNLGIADGVDLGWKLAAVRRGWGGGALLDSYEAERRPVHQRVIDEAVGNYAHLSNHFVREHLEAPGPAGEAARREVGASILASKVREFKTLGVVLGYTYSGSPVIVADGTPPPAPSVADYRPTAHPGCLAPHLWLADGSSLYDRFGPDMTLLVTGDAAGGDVDRLVSAARARAVPLAVIAPHDDRLRALYGARLVLIRPDQHVAWRGDRLERDPEEIFDILRGGAPEQYRREQPAGDDNEGRIHVHASP